MERTAPASIMTIKLLHLVAVVGFEPTPFEMTDTSNGESRW